MLAYYNDISKHAPQNEVIRIHQVLRSLPSQLGKENRKFVYSAVKKGGRAKEFEIAIQWLVDAGIVEKITGLSTPKLPFQFYEEFDKFKLYLLDCGLFGAMVDANPAVVLAGENLFHEYKGIFSELYLAQQLLVADYNKPLFYYHAERSQVEIDFLSEVDNIVCPIEVKAEGNVKGKSLKLFTDKYQLPRAVRFSMLPYNHKNELINLPLYVAFAWRDWLC